MRFIALFLTATLLGTFPAKSDQVMHFSSGPGRTVMIELYTSEGCNSCPPAEAYLNRFVANPALWKRFIPLAFHVDYWDDLGWKDRYARPAHSQRQRDYATLRQVRTVYTPAFIVNGQEWRRGWRETEPPGGDAQVGTLTLRVDDKIFEATFAALQPTSAMLQLHVAVLGMGLTTEIRAGENAGRHARHEFVVLAHEHMSSDDRRWRGTLPVPKQSGGAQRLALVAWVSRPGDPTPLQATGGYLPAPARPLR